VGLLEKQTSNDTFVLILDLILKVPQIL